MPGLTPHVGLLRVAGHTIITAARTTPFQTAWKRPPVTHPSDAGLRLRTLPRRTRGITVFKRIIKKVSRAGKRSPHFPSAGVSVRSRSTRAATPEIITSVNDKRCGLLCRAYITTLLLSIEGTTGYYHYFPGHFP